MFVPPNNPVPILIIPPLEFEDEILVYVEEKVEEIPLGHPDNPVDNTPKLLVYASLV